ncbi:hypothetical protein PMY38_03020 [Clostridium tertium]|uniref:hypothetical protein n=1 Tax=Clostridium tertium TaxID=1559 RepID=UPI002330894C|nr:hypothetical protein [Clostridium tertium]MDB1955464.1 hypothetical protein [Clostridium tertium]MDB1957560.1 hypothetical protein [Clostridium tertium]MDB1962696.1 hypothetical protein [Clostridium tertium]MDB1966741.1 hypothetical protein [Clostridium tertium]
MKTYLKEVVDMHQIALNLTYTESTMLYNIMFELTKEFHNIDDSLDDIYIKDEIYFELYASIMFRFMTILINLK